MKIITMSNEAGLVMTRNMVTSAEKVGIPLSDVVLYKLEDVDQKDADYGSQSFTKMMRKKVEVILDAMETEKELLWVDSDIVFLENCLEDVRIRGSLSELCFQPSIHQGSFCAGFYYIKSSPRTKWFLKEVIDAMDTKPDVDDEYMINTMYWQCGIQATTLPYWQYPVGPVYFETNPVFRLNEDAYIVHNNYIIGNEKKIERFKKFNLWNVDDSVLDRVETRIWKTSK